MTDNRTSSGDEWAEETQNQQPAWVSTDYVGNSGGEEQRTFSRRRSMECSAIELQIIHTEVNQDHTVYVIKVTCGMRSWLVKRRYKDFDYLDRKLRKHLPAVTMPSLPPKSYWRSSNNPSVVEQRKQQLQDYLHTLLGMNQIWARNDLVLFLNDESNIMTFIWSVERMRRLKEMLRLTKVEDQDEAEKINSDLEEARKQVDQLQAKLSQMEMIFLQQATGAASQQLSSSVLRSLSRADNPLSLQLALELTQEHAALYEEEYGNDYDTQNGNNNNDDLQVDIAGPDATGASAGDSDEDEEDENGSNHQKKVNSPQVKSAMEPEELMKALSLAQGSESVADYVKKKTSKHQVMTLDEARTLTISFEIQEALRISEELIPSLSPQPPASQQQQSDSEASSRTGQLSVSGLGASSSVDAVMKGLLHQEATAAISTLLDYSNKNEDGENTTVQWVSDVFDVADTLLAGLTPTSLSLDTRQRIFKYVRDLIARTVGCQAFPHGSFVSHTFLPDGDLDVTAFVPKLVDDAWYVKINEALCFAAASNNNNSSTNNSDTASATDLATNGGEEQQQTVIVRNVTFVNAGEVKQIQSMMNGIRVDIATNQLPSILIETLIERVDEFIGQQHLFKRSLLLVKAWLSYESLLKHGIATNAANSMSLLDKVSTSAIVVILVYVFQNEGLYICSPFQALVHFFLTMLNFDWGKYAITIQGMVKLTDMDHYQPNSHQHQHHHHHRNYHRNNANNNQQSSVSTSNFKGFFPEALFDFLIGDEIRSERVFQRGNSGSNNTVTATSDSNESEKADNTEVKTIAEVKAQVAEVPAAAPTLEISTDANTTEEETKNVDNNVTSKEATPASTPSRPRHHHNNSGSQRESYKRGIFNVIDPFQHQHNLFAALEVQDIEVIVSAMVQGYKQVQNMLDQCAAAYSSSSTSGGDVTSLMRTFWQHSFTKLNPSNVTSEGDESTKFDVFQIAKPDLHFSRFYGSIALGSKIELATLTQMILIILDKRGPMPVGEIGKNLQAIFGCENLSRRLKDQFTGLKRAIENANTPRLRVGNEHQFNPVVSLVGESSVLPEFSPEEARWACYHAAYMFTPYQISLAMQAQLTKDLQLQAQRLAAQQRPSTVSRGSMSGNTSTMLASSAMNNVVPASSSAAAAPSSSAEDAQQASSTISVSTSASPSGSTSSSPIPSPSSSAHQQRSRGGSGSNFSHRNQQQQQAAASPSSRNGALYSNNNTNMRSPNRRNNNNNNQNNNNYGHYNNNANNYNGMMPNSMEAMMMMMGMPLPSHYQPPMMPLSVPIDPVTGTPIVPPPGAALPTGIYPPTMYPIAIPPPSLMPQMMYQQHPMSPHSPHMGQMHYPPPMPIPIPAPNNNNNASANNNNNNSNNSSSAASSGNVSSNAQSPAAMAQSPVQHHPHLLHYPPPQHVYYHHSMSNSVSSSYGTNNNNNMIHTYMNNNNNNNNAGSNGNLSPMMGQSPTPPAFMHLPPHLMNQSLHPHHPQATSAGGAPHYYPYPVPANYPAPMGNVNSGSNTGNVSPPSGPVIVQQQHQQQGQSPPPHHSHSSSASSSPPPTHHHNT